MLKCVYVRNDFDLQKNSYSIFDQMAISKPMDRFNQIKPLKAKKINAFHISVPIKCFQCSVKKLRKIIMHSIFLYEFLLLK